MKPGRTSGPGVSYPGIDPTVFRTSLTAAGVQHLYRCHDWSQLRGADVDVHRNGSHFRSGRVDATTRDGKILWLAQDGVTDRTLIDQGEGFELWITLEELRKSAGDGTGLRWMPFSKGS